MIGRLVSRRLSENSNSLTWASRTAKAQPEAHRVPRWIPGKAPMDTSSSYEPEYAPIDLDLLQARVFALEQISKKKDQLIENLRSSYLTLVEHNKSQRKYI
ncbi:hypothetical protein E3N88_12213 [Mikania micrantha]|uniref:Uncharacterized protein n=1 Tax=Mikania micrantha TaxID=192012 RepID=A0A5N6P4V5_9ASTR|nr:hypothetical protein E3N88_12213 [Mikania micrantha]